MNQMDCMIMNECEICNRKLIINRFYNSQYINIDSRMFNS
jgi:hypothetical protein